VSRPDRSYGCRQRDRGSIRVRLFPSAFVTQIARASAAIADGVAPTPMSATSFPVRESTTPTESPTAVRTSPPSRPRKKAGIATATAIAPANAESRTARRLYGEREDTFSALSGGNSVWRPSMSSWKRCSGGRCP
jgi:hypothetical protein